MHSPIKAVVYGKFKKELFIFILKMMIANSTARWQVWEWKKSCVIYFLRFVPSPIHHLLQHNSSSSLPSSMSSKLSSSFSSPSSLPPSPPSPFPPPPSPQRLFPLNGKPTSDEKPHESTRAQHSSGKEFSSSPCSCSCWHMFRVICHLPKLCKLAKGAKLIEN